MDYFSEAMLPAMKSHRLSNLIENVRSQGEPSCSKSPDRLVLREPGCASLKQHTELYRRERAVTQTKPKLTAEQTAKIFSGCVRPVISPSCLPELVHEASADTD